ncbi:hypothetical protein HN858_03745 [Candidatus Falkowbacteria bacterium]|jgi:hypothetical protein|nr:hypothetical protein [Candidatus Falkowbacteria bacterium]MBT6573808.1 hypothetical protein [Candidatus Falkowbacteria bacterium]MBT7348764.1 hypothetical protein [Candidatus Falkowbacteria bacterium]MBT7500554.1 hypothetical protein [Candidatus Falkowbacteria bacterium]
MKVFKGFAKAFAFIIVILLFTCSGTVQAAEYFPLVKKLGKIEAKTRTVYFHAITFLVETQIGDTLYSIEEEQITRKLFLGEYVRWQNIKQQNSITLPPNIQPNEMLKQNQLLLIFGFSKTFSQ